MSKRIYNIDETLFITNIIPESSYLLGLFWADAWLSATKNDYSIAIEIQSEDINSISHIFNKVGDWAEYSRKRKNWSPMTRKYVTNKVLWNYLHNNFYRDKMGQSACKILQTIPINLQFYWWRGYFDGDGTVGKYSRSRVCSFCSDFNQDWAFVFNLFKKLQIKYSYLNSPSTLGKHSKVYTQNKDGISKFFNYIYPQGYDFGFKRKYDKFQLVLD